MQLQELKKLAKTVEEHYHSEFTEISTYIFEHPELSGEEYESAQYLVKYLKQKGFEITFPYAELPTAFRAEFGNKKGRTIAFLAEYDALPIEREGIKAAHMCGHNWIAATAVASAVVLSKLTEHFDGNVVVLGTPAEETYGAKVNMVNAGAFAGIDVVMQTHLERITNIYCASLAMNAIEFNFIGKSTHAASYPHEGINALDAVQLMYAGINALRQHLKPDVRIHGIITNGGEAPNIVPDKATCKFYVRANEKEYLSEVVEKVINCARGASMMTGANFKYSYFENPFDNLIHTSVLQKLIRKNLEEENIFVPNLEDILDLPGSSDIGNVSQICPTIYFEVDLGAEEPLSTHAESALKLVNGKVSHEKLKSVVNAMVGTALEIYLDDKIVQQAWEKYKKIDNKN